MARVYQISTRKHPPQKRHYLQTRKSSQSPMIALYQTRNKPYQKKIEERERFKPPPAFPSLNQLILPNPTLITGASISLSHSCTSLPGNSYNPTTLEKKEIKLTRGHRMCRVFSQRHPAPKLSHGTDPVRMRIASRALALRNPQARAVERLRQTRGGGFHGGQAGGAVGAVGGRGEAVRRRWKRGRSRLWGRGGKGPLRLWAVVRRGGELTVFFLWK